MAQFPQLSGGLALLLGLMTALLLFASVVAHELGHSFAAKAQGIDVKSITLFIFGGLASLEKESKTPAGAFWVAIAGPLVSLLLFGLFTVTGFGLTTSGPLPAILGVLGAVNLALALFNLIPGLPLDGGNILKSIVWKITGNPYKGVVFASRVGQIFGWVAIASGLLPLLFFGSFANFWNLLVGFRSLRYLSVGICLECLRVPRIFPYWVLGGYLEYLPVGIYVENLRVLYVFYYKVLHYLACNLWDLCQVKLWGGSLELFAWGPWIFASSYLVLW